ncbi:MAG: TraR/DksA C4-type zinc finger protein [Candidatus Sedimenticola sp. PURPLELP]
MGEIDQERFRQLLLKRREELLAVSDTADEAAGTVELDQTRVGRLSRMDALQAQAMSQENQRRREVELKCIAAALRRINEDEFGFCLDCGDEIAEKRLEFNPAASLCIDCANKSESPAGC